MASIRQSSTTEPVSLAKLSLFELLSIGLYSLLILWPDNSTIILIWPWCFIYQLMLLLPWLWCFISFSQQKRIVWLGYSLDYGFFLTLVGLLCISLFSTFPQQTTWYSWSAVSTLAMIYVLNAWYSEPQKRQKLLTIQSGLCIAFVLLSIWLWGTETWLPEIMRLQRLGTLGLNLSFNFSVLELRNWAPIGHQNYVAGYLVLNLPLLLGHCFTAKTRLKRALWLLCTGLGLLALYTTSSRGGWLGLAIIGILVILGAMYGTHSSFIKRCFVWLGVVLGLSITILTNNRLRALFSPDVFSSSGAETAFRIITNWTGWLIGKDHPFFGAGPGSVALLYQHYHPDWAGQEAEWVHQLHSTPAQIWAECGALGAILSLALIGWLLYWGIKLWRSPTLTERDRVMTWSILSGLAGYGVVALTDYQLDIVAIVGTLAVYLACFLSLLRQYFPSDVDTSLNPRIGKILCLSMVGLLIAVGIWLTPILRAWQLSSVGFANLQANNIEGFTENLERAHQLAPWEPYYLNQLAWSLGNIGLQASDPAIQQTYLKESQTYFKKSIEVSPYQEFAYSNLGWLQLVTGQSEAIQTFVKASQLVPAKRFAFNSLGLSLLQQGRQNEAIEAFSIEILRNPMWLTSPAWRSPQLLAITPQVQDLTLERYQQLLAQSHSPELTTYLHRCLGSLYWWRGDLKQAKNHWQQGQNSLGLELLKIAQNQGSESQIPILNAWQKPDQRTEWVKKALLIATESPPQTQKAEAIVNGMNQSTSIDQWVKQFAPISNYRRERSGFGVISRHIDGPAPIDFVPIVDNSAMMLFFPNFLPTLRYNAQLDHLLQPYREALWSKTAI